MPGDLLLAIVGPTASGKTRLALDCARALGGELVGTDSMQAYTGLSIGTAKPTAQELGEVPHHMIDIWPISHAADIAEFQARARSSIEDVSARRKQPIVVGGSVLYINAVLDDYVFPGTDPEVRAHYEALLARNGVDWLFQLLRDRDPQAAAEIQANNARRIVRALEVIDITGEPFKARLPDPPIPYYSAVRVGIDIDRTVLDQLIERRVDSMIDKGFVEEVDWALSQGLRDAVTASKAIGYSHIVKVLDGQTSLEVAREDMIRATQAFSRRQQRWLRQDPRITWFTYNDSGLSVQVVSHFNEILSAHQGGKKRPG
ncbi:MAG: tRNA (adenosine(37)-N6)-dimethylallyltransferase MiaA [Candidatus Nanopelagicales bacterium]|nr:tRNA (adenosine(37)-N6)-dimethylallyltransferase MiaA [Candidatus Nanopelagicales bacterium]